MQILSDFDLKSSNTFAIPAQAAFFISCESKEDILTLTKDEFFRSQPYLLIGGGSNLLFLKDFKGCVVRYAATDVEIIREDERSVTLRVAAGKRWHDLVLEMAQRGLWGIENLAFIPGDCGAAAVQNIGAYGTEAKDLIEKVEVVEIATGNILIFTNEECEYAYRQSKFKNEWKDKYLVLSVTYKLSRNYEPKLDYGNIRSALAQKGMEHPTAAELRNTIIDIRNAKLPDPERIGNAGSFFMNPIVSKEKYRELTEQFGNIPHYNIDATHEKIPAGWMIDQCGWKGKALGRAGVYDKQALVLVNLGGATGSEIVQLYQTIQQDVKNKFGIEIHPEVNVK